MASTWTSGRRTKNGRSRHAPGDRGAALPNVLIIGAGKCGTTSLHHYLGHHPEIAMSPVKELAFFVREKNWTRGLAWYESQFSDTSAAVRGEASPQYTKHPVHRGVPERIQSVIPEVRLIYLVRDPIERLVSYYVDRRSVADEEPTLEAAIASSPHDYVSASRYHMQIEQYLPYFPLERLLVVEQEELLTNRRDVLREVFRFLGVDDSFDHPGFDPLVNPSSYKRRCSAPIARPVVDSDLRERLHAALKPDADRLRALTGRTFERWSL